MSARICPNCALETSMMEPVIMRGHSIDICSHCVVEILSRSPRAAIPDAPLSTAVDLANLVIGQRMHEIWPLWDPLTKWKGRPRKDVLTILFVGLVAAMMGTGIEQTLATIIEQCPAELPAPLSSRSATRSLHLRAVGHAPRSIHPTRRATDRAWVSTIASAPFKDAARRQTGFV